MATTMKLTCLLLLVIVDHVTGTAPNFCSYNDEGVYECAYASMVLASNRPINYTLFNPAPQRIELSVNGFLPFFGDTAVFSSGFAGISVAGFDANYPAELTVDCGYAGSIYMSAGAFANMSYIQRLTVRNCNTYMIPASAFTDLGDLDYFGFERGTIDDVDPNAMAGLSVERLSTASHTFPQNLGHFEVFYSPFSNKYVPPGLLFSWKNLTAASLVGADIETISSDVFKYNTKLRSIDLTDNTFTVLPDGIFSGLDMLADVFLYNINFECSCTNNWFVPYAETNNITLRGELMCSNEAGTSAGKYYYDNCVIASVCGETTGITSINNTCLSMIALIAYICGFVALVICIVCLILTILAKKQVGQKSIRKVKARGRWNKVMDSTIKKTKMKVKSK